jgi:hypothetical protein
MRHWTPEERARQSRLIRKWKPWKQSTGARTVTGKAASKMNAYRHGMRSVEVRAIRRTIWQYQRLLRELQNMI